MSTDRILLKSALKLKVKVHLPYEVNWDKQFGVAIGIDSDKGKKTQVVMAVWKPAPLG